ncbi:MAG: cupin domain-containing protein [Oscillospiraceae bacterium]|nr:cupin domain-containing protein [Oscillospiraceae bacterium]
MNPYTRPCCPITGSARTHIVVSGSRFRQASSDELFLVIEGSFAIEFEEGLVPLSQGDLIVIPKGTLHRPVCTELVKCLLIELDGTLNDDNKGGTYTKGRSA